MDDIGILGTNHMRLVGEEDREGPDNGGKEGRGFRGVHGHECVCVGGCWNEKGYRRYGQYCVV